MVTWHVHDDGTLRLYRDGGLIAEVILSPDQWASFGIACWRAAQRKAEAERNADTPTK